MTAPKLVWSSKTEVVREFVLPNGKPSIVTILKSTGGMNKVGNLPITKMAAVKLTLDTVWVDTGRDDVWYDWDLPVEDTGIRRTWRTRIDLTAIDGEDWTGKRLRFLAQSQINGGGGKAIRVAVGESNGYPIPMVFPGLGGGRAFVQTFNGPVIASNNKNLDVEGKFEPFYGKFFKPTVTLILGAG